MLAAMRAGLAVEGHSFVLGDAPAAGAMLGTNRPAGEFCARVPTAIDGGGLVHRTWRGFGNRHEKTVTDLELVERVFPAARRWERNSGLYGELGHV